MPPKTVTRALIKMLEDLTEAQLEKFCYALLDRREEPRVTRVSLEGKTRLQIADALVSTYTESGAKDVVLETLREIDCNAQRERFADQIKESSSSSDARLLPRGKPDPLPALWQSPPSSSSEHLPAKDTGPLASSYGNIMEVKTTGASWQTAQQDQLKYSGVRASHTMAETDADRMQRYKSKIITVGGKYGIDPALIAAIISRQSRAGNALDNGWGDSGNAWGLMQVNVNPNGGGHTKQGAWDSKTHLCQATEILVYFIGRIRNKFPNWSTEQQLKGGIAAYMMGDGSIHSCDDVDGNTTGGEFCNDVVARAQWYKNNRGF